jgi:hypothetical protein
MNSNFYSDPNLTLVEAPILAATEVAIDQDHLNSMQQELEAAAEMELPEGEDEDF